MKQNRLVAEIRVDLLVLECCQPLGMRVESHHIRIHLLGCQRTAQDFLGGRASSDADLLARQGVEGGIRALSQQDGGSVHERRDREVHLLPATQRDRIGSAEQIGSAVDDGLEAVVSANRHVGDLDVVAPHGLPDPECDGVADHDRVARRLARVVGIGKRCCILPHTQADFAGLLYPVEHACSVSRPPEYGAHRGN